ncbi:MAG: hypothetical protein AABY07_03240, partial [Nanoarchaeota archaeon]
GGSTVYIRVNGVNTALSVAIANSAAAGFYEDTTNSVSVAVGDEYNFFADHGGGAGSLNLDTIGFELAQPVAAAGEVYPEAFYRKEKINSLTRM